MKNLMLLFCLFFPVLLTAQYYGGKRCHTDLILGYDYGNVLLQGEEENPISYSSIHSFRLGMNLNFQIANNFALVSGFRLASKKLNTRQNYIENISITFNPTYTRTKDLHDIYGEIPFGLRYLMKNFSRDSRLFIEGGIQFNFYIVSFNEQLDWGTGISFGSEKRIERLDEVYAANLGSQISVGWEYDLSERLKYFIQPIGRFQLLRTRKNPDALAYHVGLETGLRF